MVVRWMVVAFAAAQGPCALRRGVAFPPGGGEAPRLKVAEDNVHGLSPYTLVGISGSALLEPGSSCDSPSHGDVVVGAAKAKVFNGTLANAVEAWRLDSNFQKASESYVFPVVDDAADGDGDGAGESFGLKGWMVVRFEPLANAPVAFAPAAAGGRDRKLVDRAVEALEKKKVAEFKSLAEMHALAAAAALSKAAELQRKLDEARLVVEAAERLRIEEEAEAVLVLERSRVDAAKAKIRAAELQAKRSDEDKAKQALEVRFPRVSTEFSAHGRRRRARVDGRRRCAWRAWKKNVWRWTSLRRKRFRRRRL
ncbi:hypothetical protein M885DRAFT_274444 [Pelagophyceae sp. CCMP2097]|nr:hypothetical protein M885DRAFT_274444 [Pelagophyceae sp. CCMP2097]